MKNKISIYHFLLPYMHMIKKTFLASTLLIITGETLGRLGNFFGSQLIGLISITPNDRTSILTLGLFYIFLYTLLSTSQGIIVNLSVLLESYYLPRAKGKMAKNLFKIIHEKAPFFFEQEMSGNIASKIRNVVNESEMLYFSFFWGFLKPAVVVLITFISFLLINVTLALTLLVIISIYTYIMYLAARKIIPYSKDNAHKNALATAELIDSITNAETVKSFARIHFEKRHYYKSLKSAALSEQKLIQKKYQFGLSQGISRSIIQALFCFICVFFWYYDQLSIADFVFVQSLTITLVATIGNTIGDFLKFFSRIAIIQNGLELILEPTEIKDRPNAPDLHISKGEIIFDDITYGYTQKKTIFKNFSLKINPGEKIGLAGYSGSGKSTLIKLINRFYDVSKGKILIDAQPINDVTQSSLHTHIAVIPQEPTLFNRTILENIRYGKPDATDEEVFMAAQKAYAHDFILSLPMGYQSKVGERGIMLSGGERQRIAIARAILKNAPILILDEATSALDSESEKYIQASLNELMQGKTVIAIAHRLSTLKKMDRIIVLEKGRIMEDGSHHQLCNHKGIYQHLYEIQMQIQKNLYIESESYPSNE